MLTTNEMENYLSPSEAARLAGRSPQRIRQLIAAGVLASVRTPLGRLIERAALERYIENRAASRGPSRCRR